MKHSKDTSGFSSDSLLPFVGGHLLPPLSFPPSNFRIFSADPGATRPGDLPVLLADCARPRPGSARVTGDIDLLPELSPLSLLLPYPDAGTGRARPGEGSDLLAGDLPTVFSLCSSPENGRFLDLAGDRCLSSRNSDLLSPVRSLLSVTEVEALTLSLRVLQISDASDRSSAVNGGLMLTTAVWRSLLFSRGADLMNGLSHLPWKFGIGIGGLGVSERTSLTVSSSASGWLGGGDLLTLPCMVVEEGMWPVF